MVARAAASRLTIVATSIRSFIESCSSINAAPGKALRTRVSKRTLPGTWWPTSSGCASILVSSAGRSLAAPGAARWRWLTRRRIRIASPNWCCAEFFFAARKRFKWFYQEGASAIFADVWEEYLKVIPEAERGDMVSAYHRRLTSDDLAIRVEAARAWSIWEGSTSKLFFDPASIERFADPEFALAFARIECHYFMNNSFFPTDNYLIENVGKIRHIPARIVQGRYDVVCPMTSAWDLHRAWPEADLRIIQDAGHSITEPGIIDALVDATDHFGVGR